MSAMTKIIYSGELAAVVVADQAILTNDTLSDLDQWITTGADGCTVG